MRKLLISIILLMFISCAKDNKAAGHIVAKVESSTLTEDEAERLAVSVSKQNYSINDVVTDWVDRELLFLAAKRGGFENDNTLNLQVEAYRKDLLGKTFMDGYVSPQVSIKNEEIKAYYDKNRGFFIHKTDGSKILHFFTTSDSVAQNIFNILMRPDTNIDRKEFLATYNLDVKIVEKGNLIDKLDSEIFSNNKTNTVVGPVKTDYGYHVIEILSRFKGGSQIDIDEAYDEIYQRLFNQKKAILSNQFLDSLRNHYSIKINLESYK